MMAHILKTAMNSQLFDVIHISTEDKRIARVAEELGAPVQFYRPLELADDFTPIMPVLKYVVETFLSKEEIFDQVWLLMACSPLVEPKDLVNASQSFDSVERKHPILSVAEYPAPIEWAFTQSENGKLEPVQPGLFSTRSQDLQTKYYDTGAFSVFPVSSVLDSQGAGTDNNFFGHVISKEKAIDIDSEDDWQMAELIYRSVNTLQS